MVRGKARRLLALIEASLEILQQVQPATMEDTGTLRVSASSGVKHPTRRGLPVDPRREGNHTAVGSRYPGGLDLVRVPGDLADAGAAGDPPDPAGPAPGRGRRALLPDPPRPIPVGPQASGGQGARTACRRQEHGVDVSSDPSEPPTGSLHRLQGERRLRTAHLAPGARSR
jgi:hypothetical protein